jgi:HSP20 family protein
MRLDFPWAGEINRLQNEIDRVFGDRNGGSTFGVRAYPPINMWEDDDNLYVESEVPGMDLEAFEIFVNDSNQLTLQGERKKPVEENAKFHREERNFGRFSRVLTLPVLVDADATAAQYRSGVLLITLPKKAEAKPRRIKVNMS